MSAKLTRGLPDHLAKAVKSLYWRWASMKQRCDNPNNPDYKNYGGRGITYCAGLSDFPDYAEAVLELPPGDLLEVIGKKRRGHLWLDRIDNNGGYFCGLCEECLALARECNIRWSSPIEQANNKRR